jgi:2-C-methyl-D-erythritol 4-phosphate cytidylyltransferase
MQHHWVVIIPAAGSGTRFGGAVPKQFQDLDGIPILVRSVRQALAHPFVSRVLVAVNASMIEHASALFANALDRVLIIEGGSERQHSIAQCINHPATEGASLLFVHDAVRPFADSDLYSRVGEAALLHGAAIPVVGVADTVKEVDSSGFVMQTLQRSHLRAIQTPQAFRPDTLRQAYAYAAAHGVVGTDDASLVEAFGATVATVNGDHRNIKITTPLDLIIAHHLVQHHGNH